MRRGESTMSFPKAHVIERAGHESNGSAAHFMLSWGFSWHAGVFIVFSNSWAFLRHL